MTKGIYTSKIELPYEDSTSENEKNIEITTSPDVESILLKGEGGDEKRNIRVHTKVPNKIFLIKFREPDFFIDDKLKLYRCLKDKSRPYEVNTVGVMDIRFGGMFGGDEKLTPYILKMAICGHCSTPFSPAQLECADTVIYCPKCDRIFE